MASINGRKEAIKSDGRFRRMDAGEGFVRRGPGAPWRPACVRPGAQPGGYKVTDGGEL